MENTHDGEYHGRTCTVYGVSNYRQTTHAYLEEEQQKFGGNYRDPDSGPFDKTERIKLTQ